MAKEQIDGNRRIVSMSPKETVDLIGLLVAQLANVSLIGNASGAVPEVMVFDRGTVLYRLLFFVDGKA